uniref:CCHC-type domain-containing protein n=1 Tax=Brassica oleracea var. oleracea TaxID=109376 RepID=A0A0D3B8L9_BRAOL
MAPRKVTDDQLEEIGLMLETFTTGLQVALQTSVTNALQTVLQEQHRQHAAQGDNPQNHQQQRDEQVFASNDEDVVDNVFTEGGPNQRGRHNNAQDFIDWLNTVKEILEFCPVPDDARVSLVVTRFKGRAMAWWQKLKESCQQANKTRINSWDRLTKHMRHGFLPFNYERTLYNKLQNLRQGSRSVDEYATEFFYMTARMTTSETQQQLISRFIGGLRYKLQVALAQFNPSTVYEAHQRAVSMELQLRSSGSSTSRARFPTTSALDTIGQSATDRVLTRSDTPKVGNNTDTIANSRPPHTNALRCFTCGERGHIQTSCPKQTRRGLVIQEDDDDEPHFRIIKAVNELTFLTKENENSWA